MLAKLRLVTRDGALRAPAEPTDPELVERLVARDEIAAALTWRRYSSLVRGLASRVLGPRGDVEDLLQEVFSSLFRRIGALRDPAALRSFVIGIALREIRAELRRRHVRRWLHLTDTGTLPEPAADDGAASDAEVFDHLHRALDMLAPRGRIAFVLRHIEGYELTEVASAIGASLATTKRVIARSQERLAAIAHRDPVLAPYFGSHSEEV